MAQNFLIDFIFSLIFRYFHNAHLLFDKSVYACVVHVNIWTLDTFQKRRKKIFWTQLTTESAFERALEYLSYVTLLVRYDVTASISSFASASQTAIEAVLQQRVNGH